MGKWEKEIEAAVSILSGAKRACASSGAGISAESGIPTFRDPGGLWDEINPIEAGTAAGLVNVLEKNADKIIPIFLKMLDSFEQAEPNPGHIALFDLEKMGILKTVITQNVDNLHREAGNTDLIEVHGNLFRMVCMRCGWLKTVDRKSYVGSIREKLISFTVYDFNSMISLADICEQCDSIMRPDVVMFGEAVKGLQRAFSASLNADVMLVLGTSGVVYPAASFPIEAKNAGARVIVINPTENGFQNYSDVYIPMKTGEALPIIVSKIRENR
jgi:NAD-dependent deacetylase